MSSSVDGPWTPVVLSHALFPLAQPKWNRLKAIIQAHHSAPQTLQQVQSVRGSHAQAALCCLCPRGHTSSATASFTARADATDPPTPAGHRHLEALLSAYGL